MHTYIYTHTHKHTLLFLTKNYMKEKLVNACLNLFQGEVKCKLNWKLHWRLSITTYTLALDHHH